MSDDRIFSDSRSVSALLKQIKEVARGIPATVTFMEVCGTHTHAIGAAGLRRLLPEKIRLVSGPGCPVCVTPVGFLDRAEALAALPETVICTFGDLYRVPSSRSSLERSAAEGCSIQIVYSPRDALEIAAQHPQKRVIFLAVGFETTTPGIVATLAEAEERQLRNFMILPGNKIIPPALEALADDPELRLHGFILPGHVSVITGSDFYSFLASRFHLPAVVTGFTPADILRCVLELCRQVAEGEAKVVNHYGRVVTAKGNGVAQDLVKRYMEPADADWRGLGPIPGSGLALRKEWVHRDALEIPVPLPKTKEPEGCRCGDVLKGLIDPPECHLFNKGCSPDHPVGACMVSSEGSCAAWHRHERRVS
ncbi:MAG: hydrogenase formation protein HypD [Candidatus Eisenbacteria bacterium]|nr:hydrogenase formation protein HypD [Candidatus Eisenbacteria bacterium]